MTLSRYLYALLALLITVLSVLFAVRNLDVGEFVDAFREAQGMWLLAGAILIVADFFLRAIRWRYFLLRFARYRLMRDCFTNYMIGYMANMVFPLKAGELVRPGLFAVQHTRSMASLLTMVLAERLLDITVLAVLFLVAWSGGAEELSPAVVGGILYLGLAAFLVLVIGWAMAMHHRTRTAILRWLRHLPGVSGRLLSGLAARVFDALSLFSSPRILSGTTFSSLAVWVAASLSAYCFMQAFGLALPWHAAVVVLAIVNFGMVIPSSPGAIGLAHGLYVFALGLYGVDESVALGLGVVAHGTGFLLVTLTGLFCTWIEGLSVRDLWANRSLPTPPCPPHE